MPPLSALRAFAGGGLLPRLADFLRHHPGVNLMIDPSPEIMRIGCPLLMPRWGTDGGLTRRASPTNPPPTVGGRRRVAFPWDMFAMKAHPARAVLTQIKVRRVAPGHNSGNPRMEHAR